MAEETQPPEIKEPVQKTDPLVKEMIGFGVSLYYGSRFFSYPPTSVAHALRESIGSLKSEFDPTAIDFLYRARLHSPRMEDPGKPYRGEAILNPPGNLACAGRLNCSGISRLYLASTQDVAAAEIRAVTGDYVTVARFKLSQRIGVFDFRNIEKRADGGPKELLAYIRRIISVPVFSYDNYECVLSQWITEYMQQLGVHAVIFPSVMRGQSKEEKKLVHDILKISPREYFNVCAFYPSQFQLIADSETVMRVHELSLYVATDETYYKIKALREFEANPKKYVHPPED